jgi:AcrR family transcriptional regulator
MRRRPKQALPEPQQQRSRDTVHRITSATVRLLARKTFEEISIAEISRAARISVGGFYARFPSKESLLDWFDQNLLEEELLRIPESQITTRWKSWTQEEIVTDHFTRWARFLQKHRELLSRIFLSLRSQPSLETLQRAHSFNEVVHRPFVNALLTERNTIRHPDPEKAIRFALMVVTSALREEILFGDRRLFPIDLPQRPLVRELTILFLSYLHKP